MDLPILGIACDLAKYGEDGSSRIVVKAPTGSGKSTKVPAMVQKAIRGRVLVVQPRRMAAILLARFVAKEEQVKLGDEVGYAVRFDSKYKASTKIVFVTDGVLMRLLQSDPSLSDFDAIVFDEFHERRLSSDVALAQCVRIQELRKNFKIVVMSATLDTDVVTDYLVGSQVHEVEGRTYPVDVSYTSPSLVKRGKASKFTEPIWQQVSKACKKAIQNPDVGNILIFLPGVFEINRTIRELESASWLKGWEIVPLHSSLSADAQSAALIDGGTPKIIASTNVAETSLTIPGVKTVIDSGLARIARFDPRRGMNALLIESISKAAADQRAGRAGRIAPGRCIRLWSQSNHTKRVDFTDPEIHRVELSETLLHLIALGENPNSFAWIEQPKQEMMNQALDQLRRFGALDVNDRITELGQAMFSLPLEPRLARLVLAGKEFNCLEETLFLAAALQGESLFLRKRSKEQIERFQQETDCSDFVAEWRAWMEAVRCHFQTNRCSELGVLARVAKEWMMSIRQLAQHRMIQCGEQMQINLEHKEEFVMQALLTAFSDRLACRLSASTLSCRVVGSRRGKLDENSMAKKSAIFLATEMVEIGGRELEVKLSRCGTIDDAWLKAFNPDGFREETSTTWDSVKKKIVSLNRKYFQDLILEESENTNLDKEKIPTILAVAVLDGQLKWNGWNDAVEQWISRMNLLAAAMPEMGVSSIDNDERLLMLEQSFDSATTYKEIKSRTLDSVIQEWLSPVQWELLNLYVPKTLLLSNGANVKVKYSQDGVAKISLRVQQLYDVEETPTILDGKKLITVEILAPNQRPWQVTEDLRSFWKSGFAQMRKDLAGRYPKHDWRT